VFKPRKIGQQLEAPHYQFMTDEDLNKERQRVAERLRAKLQVPPMLHARTPSERVLARDPELEGLHDSKLVCLDISPDISDRKRMMSVREPDGTLRTASWDERGRVTQVFLPVEGRTVTPAKMFEEPQLTECLDREDYVPVLDRACLQYEPDDPDYIRVSQTAYEHVDAGRRYERLQNTRHFGALAFYLAWNRRIDNLLLHFIQLARLDHAVRLITLYRLLHLSEPISDKTSLSEQAASLSESKTDSAGPVSGQDTSAERAGSQSQSSTSSDSESSDVEQDPESLLIAAIRDYIENASVKRPVLELALQKYQQLAIERRRAAERQRQAVV